MSWSPSVVSVVASRASSGSRRSTPSPPSSVSPVINNFEFTPRSHFQEVFDCPTKQSAKPPSVPSRSSSRAPSIAAPETSLKPASVQTFVDGYYYPIELPPLVEEEEPDEQPREQKLDDIKSQYSEDAKSTDAKSNTDVLNLLCHFPRIYPKQPKKNNLEELLSDLNGLDIAQEHLKREAEANVQQSFRDV